MPSVPFLPPAMHTVLTATAVVAAPWRGNCGNTPKNTAAAAKLQPRLYLSTGTLLGPLLQAGRAHDRSSPVQHTPVPSGALRIADQGYFSLPVLADLDRHGAFW